jgi:hypothetical protein
MGCHGRICPLELQTAGLHPAKQQNQVRQSVAGALETTPILRDFSEHQCMKSSIFSLPASVVSGHD